MLDNFIKAMIAIVVALVSLMALLSVASELTGVTEDPLAVIVAAVVGAGLVFIGWETHKVARYQSLQGRRDAIRKNYYMLRKVSDDILTAADQAEKAYFLLKAADPGSASKRLSFPREQDILKLKEVYNDAQLLDLPQISGYILFIFEYALKVNQLTQAGFDPSISIQKLHVDNLKNILIAHHTDKYLKYLK